MAWPRRVVLAPLARVSECARRSGGAIIAPETKGWIGERLDADAGLQYLNARYYDPELGLFLQPDWFEVTKAGVGTNRFSYSANDPVNRLDPNGNQDAPSIMSEEEEDKLNQQCLAGGCYTGRAYAEDMKDLCLAGGYTLVAAAATPVAIYYAAILAPTAYTLGLEMAAVEATGMVAGAGGAAATAKAVAGAWDSLQIPRGITIEKALGAG